MSDEPPDRPPCVARMSNGRVCDNPAALSRVNVVADLLDLCDRHSRLVRSTVTRVVLTEIEDHRIEYSAAVRYSDRVDQAKVRLRKTSSGWQFEFTAPSEIPGQRGRRFRRSGFRTKAEAQRAAAELKLGCRDRARVEQLAEEVAALERSHRAARREAADRAAADQAVQLADAASRRREQERARIVYYVRRPNGDIKIGTTWNLDTRLAAFRNVSPVELLATHSGGQPAETALHRIFQTLRRDGEWFEPGPELLEHVDHVRRRTQERKPS